MKITKVGVWVLDAGEQPATHLSHTCHTPGTHRPVDFGR